MKKLLFVSFILSFFLQAQAQSTYWNKVVSGTSKNLLSISFGSSKVGYISGADGLILKTIDGGSSWTPLSHSGMNFSLAHPDIVNINFIDSLIGYAVVSSFAHPQYAGQLYKTTNGGSTWTAVTSGNIAAYRTFFFDQNNGYQIGSAFFAGNTLIKFTSGTWGPEVNFNYDPYSFLYAVDFRNTSTGIVGGSYGYVYRTFNGGASWDTVKTNTDSTINALAFMNDSTILAATDNPMAGILLSTDTGRTWQNEPTTLTFFYPQMKSLVRSKRDSFIAVGKINWNNQGVILWYQSGFPGAEGTDHPMNEVTMLNDSIAYAVGDSGLIMTNAKFIINGVATIATEQPIVLYPNPTEGLFTTEMKTSHTVTIYDQMGRVVHRSSGPAGKHSIDISAEAPGIYIAELTTATGERLFRKVLLR